VDGAWANNAGRTGLSEMDREQAAGTLVGRSAWCREVSLGIRFDFLVEGNGGLERHGRQPCMDNSRRDIDGFADSMVLHLAG
jgi:hypothetical protein